MQIWRFLTILASWPEPEAPKKIAGACRVSGDHLLGLGERAASSPPHIHRERAVLGAGLAAGHREASMRNQNRVFSASV